MSFILFFFQKKKESNIKPLTARCYLQLKMTIHIMNKTLMII